MLKPFYSQKVQLKFSSNETFSPPLVVHSSFKVKTYEFARRDFDQSNLEKVIYELF